MMAKFKEQVSTQNTNEHILIKLDGMARKGGVNSETASSLRMWYLRNQSWTVSQKNLINNLIGYVAPINKRTKKVRKYYLYAITNGTELKLGYSSDIEKRIKQLETGSCVNMVCLWNYYVGTSEKNAKSEESNLHKVCKKHHTKREWFKLSALELAKEYKPKEVNRVVPMGDAFTITKYWLGLNKSSSGGWSRQQLSLLGVSWPPSKGWIKELVGKVITSDQASKFETLRIS